MFTTDCDKPLPYAPFLSGAAQERRDSNVQIINNVRYVSTRISSLCREKTLNKGNKILRRWVITDKLYDAMSRSEIHATSDTLS